MHTQIPTLLRGHEAIQPVGHDVTPNKALVRAQDCTKGALPSRRHVFFALLWGSWLVSSPNSAISRPLLSDSRLLMFPKEARVMEL